MIDAAETGAKGLLWGVLGCLGLIIVMALIMGVGFLIQANRG